MTGEAIIAVIKNIEPIEGADRIVSCNLYGETVIVSKEVKEGDIGVLFDIETVLSTNVCYHNNLYRHTKLNKDKEVQGYMDDNRRVRPIRMKGVRCSGLWLPTSCLDFIKHVENLEEGDQFSAINGESICSKYIKIVNSTTTLHIKGGRIPQISVPTFKEHMETAQLAREHNKLEVGGVATITVKLHGTSCRVGNLEVEKQATWWQRLLKITPKSTYKHVVGSRRTIKTVYKKTHDPSLKSYFASDVWTDSADAFKKLNGESKLAKGETVYYEIVGYTPDLARNKKIAEAADKHLDIDSAESLRELQDIERTACESAPIMGTKHNSKLKKFMSNSEYVDFISNYGENTTFTYGCAPGEYKIFVYRMTMTTPDGDSIDYSWQQVRQRCLDLDVRTVPTLETTCITSDKDVESILERAKEYAEEYCPHFPTQLREGVVVRVDTGRKTPYLLKSKSYLFKVIEGIIKESSLTADMEDDN